MTTTSASKRTRFAALGLSTALSVGVLIPLLGTSGAEAASANCATVSSSYSTASTKLATHQAKLKKAKKALKKAKRHHKSHAVISHDRQKVKNLKYKVKIDKKNKNNYYSQQTVCSTAAAQGTATALTGLLGQLQGLLDPSMLTSALNQIADQIAASGAPGADQLAGIIKQLSAAVGSGATSIDPSQLTGLFSQLTGAGLDPTSFQKAITDAVASLESALSNPPTTPQGIVDLLLGSLANGLNTAGVPTLPGVLGQVQGLLDGLLGNVPSLPGL